MKKWLGKSIALTALIAAFVLSLAVGAVSASDDQEANTQQEQTMDSGQTQTGSDEQAQEGDQGSEQENSNEETQEKTGE